jgi:hypothetical protein
VLAAMRLQIGSLKSQLDAAQTKIDQQSETLSLISGIVSVNSSNLAGIVSSLQVQQTATSTDLLSLITRVNAQGSSLQAITTEVQDHSETLLANNASATSQLNSLKSQLSTAVESTTATSIASLQQQATDQANAATRVTKDLADQSSLLQQHTDILQSQGAAINGAATNVSIALASLQSQFQSKLTLLERD